MVGDHLRHAHRQSFGAVEVQEFVRTVSVRVRTEDAGHQELRSREALAEHADERDAASRAEVHRVLAERRARGVGEDDVQAVLRYYAAYRDELDAAISAHLAAQENFERVIQQRNARAARRAANV